MTNTTDRHPSELLPWLVNGTLEGDERRFVEQHVAGCSECRTELKILQDIRSTIQSQTLEDGGELGLQRMLREIHKTSVTRPRWLLPAAVAAGLVIIVQSAMLIQSVQQLPGYAPLSGPTAGEGVLQVEFMPIAKEGEIRELLYAEGVRIVDGPSAIGIYRLAVDPERDPQVVVKQLQGHKTLIRHVAPNQ